MLGDEEEAGGEDGGGSGDVEGVVRVAACADDIALRTRGSVVVSKGLVSQGGRASRLTNPPA